MKMENYQITLNIKLPKYNKLHVILMVFTFFTTVKIPHDEEEDNNLSETNEHFNKAKMGLVLREVYD